MKGRLIVFEGTDSSGKSTQLNLFCKKLESQGIVFEVYKFPRYDSFFGSLVAKYLTGEFGSVKDLPPEFCALLYSLDRYWVKKELEQKLAQGKILVMDRYIYSNFAHQAAKFSDARQQGGFLFWIENLESRMPKADAVVFLNMPTEAAQQLMNGMDREHAYRKGSQKDLHEEDSAYLERTRKVFELLAKKNKWAVIQCAEKAGKNFKVKSIPDIQEEVWNSLKESLK